MRSSAATAATCAALVVATLAGNAYAFCRTTTAAIPADYLPEDSGCWTSGLPIWWRNECVGYDIQQNASKQISYDDAASAIALAFLKWTSVACPTDGTTNSRVSIDVRDLGPVACDEVQYNSNAGNQHVIIFRDDSWPHDDSSNTLALTTVTFDPTTGEIYDADMEINTAQQTLTLQDPIPADGYDFQSIVTHETGHFLGMAHSQDGRATMFAEYTRGATWMRNLSVDDVQGICSIYPADDTRTVPTSVTPSGSMTADACDPTPRHGFATTCAATPSKCAVSPGIPGRLGGPGFVGGALMAAATISFLRKAGGHGRRKEAA
jgi:hypothetical protein